MVLDDTVKRRINNARDILVGKVPDPKAQIEQITIALIYKFMDDMDKKFGGGVYFKDELKDYSWDDVLNEKDSATFFKKYTDAIDLFQKTEHFPQFFKDVFKNAYVPYKDSRTLKLFLDEMNNFSYEHSEKLGDAFEFLLSVMGSQGDAGQFRTPRHIIDFIVDVLEPQIGERILDPACGTAGFLISAVKFLEKKYGKLTSQVDINNVRDNLFGFDISPDMVRLALVNMFLHGFSDPKIEEFDTLYSENYWDKKYDLILANPPFMTPKGGVEPHDLYAIDSKRAEVLFTWYILNHLKEQGSKKGRAGIIVPEGIIFQSGKAYKKLRKELVEKGLFAVVSLPSGIFNPYSGVKTSILLIDKNVKSSDILFLKVNGDGYDLGAQRRKNGKDDLPAALEILRSFRGDAWLRENEPQNLNNSLYHLVPKEKIAQDGDYNLSGERYKEVEVYNGSYPMVEFEKTINKVIYPNKVNKSEFLEDGKFPIIDQSEKFIAGYWNEAKNLFKIKKPIIVFGDHTRCIKYIDFDFVLGADGVKILEPIDDFDPKFYYYMIKKLNIRNLGYSRHYKELKIKKIPLPPIDIQKRIVEEIESYQKIIDGAKLVVDNYKPRIEIDNDWEMVELGKITNTSSGGTPLRSTKEFWKNPSIPWLRSGEVAQGRIFEAKFKISDIALKKSSVKLFPIDSVLVAMYGATVGNVGILKFESTTNQAICAIFPNKKLFISEYLFYYLKQKKEYLISLGVGGAQPNISQQIIKSLKIPLPTLEIQKQIVKQIEEEEKLVNSNKKLIEIFEKKIEQVINKVWEE